MTLPGFIAPCCVPHRSWENIQLVDCALRETGRHLSVRWGSNVCLYLFQHSHRLRMTTNCFMFFFFPFFCLLWIKRMYAAYTQLFIVIRSVKVSAGEGTASSSRELKFALRFFFSLGYSGSEGYVWDTHTTHLNKKGALRTQRHFRFDMSGVYFT